MVKKKDFLGELVKMLKGGLEIVLEAKYNMYIYYIGITNTNGHGNGDFTLRYTKFRS